jgi:MEMO1 family protein
MKLTAKWSIFLLIIPLCSCQSRQQDATLSLKGGAPVSTHIKPEDIRHPAVTGSWYSDDAAELSRQLQGYLDKAERKSLGHILGLASPHAGYAYSGPVAAWAYKQIEGSDYETVVVIAPSHADAFPFTAVYGRGGYQTPLGLLEVDTVLAKAITEGHDLVKISDRGHRQENLSRQEHSLEIQLPFLQLVLKPFKIVPIVMGDQSDRAIHQLAKALTEALMGKNVLLVASSDLSHFHPYEVANRLDSVIIQKVQGYDYAGLLKDLSIRKVEACGGGPICAVMEACKSLGADKAEVLKYANSGDVPQGNKHEVVGYLAAAFYQTNSAKSHSDTDTVEVKHPASEAKSLTLEEKCTLMSIARTTVECVVKGDKVPKFDAQSKDLLENRGAFVTLHKHGDLRGCIGYIVGIKPLYLTVREVAESAALRDPRFDPVRPSELKDLQYEISALSVPRLITDVNEITVGVHGIIIRKGYHQGLLLPQVATEYGWDRATFLRQTCRKAGLPPEAWKDPDTEIEIFSAEVFGEKDVK